MISEDRYDHLFHLAGKSHKLLLALAALTLLAGCSAAKKGFDENFDKSFKESCIASATRSGAPAAAAKSLCDCTLTKINQQFSPTEKATAGEDKLKPIMEECVKSVVQKNG
ncbi:MAG: hypothetical protein QM676_15235 [Novosphingobium sp.]